MPASKFEANGGFTLRVASGPRPPSLLLTAAAVPIHEGPPRRALVGWEGATPPLMASRRRQRRAAAASFLGLSHKTRPPRPACSSASAARPPIELVADAAVPLNGGRWARPALSAPGCWARSPSAIWLLFVHAKLLLVRAILANVGSSGSPSARPRGMRLARRRRKERCRPDRERPA